MGVHTGTFDLYSPLVFHANVADWPLEHRDVGRSSVRWPPLTDLLSLRSIADRPAHAQFWQIRFPLSEARVLFRCPPATGKDTGWPVWLPRGLQWILRVQIWREVPGGCQLHVYACLQRLFRCCLRAAGVLHCTRTPVPASHGLADYPDGAL